jgi:hypothetical protein
MLANQFFCQPRKLHRAVVSVTIPAPTLSEGRSARAAKNCCLAHRTRWKSSGTSEGWAGLISKLVTLEEGSPCKASKLVPDLGVR